MEPVSSNFSSLCKEPLHSCIIIIYYIVRELSLTGDCVFQDGVEEPNEKAIISNLTSYSAGVRDVKCHKNTVKS